MSTTIPRIIGTISTLVVGLGASGLTHKKQSRAVEQECLELKNSLPSNAALLARASGLQGIGERKITALQLPPGNNALEEHLDGYSIASNDEENLVVIGEKTDEYILNHEIGHLFHNTTKEMIAAETALTGLQDAAVAYAGISKFNKTIGAQPITRKILEEGLRKGSRRAVGVFVATNMIKDLALKKFSREHERRADAFANKHTSKKGIEDAIQNFQELDKQERQSPFFLEQMTKTHPPTCERIASMKEAALKKS